MSNLQKSNGDVEQGDFVDLTPTISASTSTEITTEDKKFTPNWRKALITIQLSGINLTTCAVNGLVVIGLPIISEDLHLHESLQVWPSSAASLATAATLLLAGTIADLAGARITGLAGEFACGLLMLASGASHSGTGLIAVRALQGIALSFHLASSVALVTESIERGKGRNLAFACLGLSQPLGFSFGLVLGGVLVDTMGWRGGWYIYGGITLGLAAMGAWVLPTPRPVTVAVAVGKPEPSLWRRLKGEIDWVGALLISAFMTAISTFLGFLGIGIHNIGRPECIVVLCLSGVFLPAFIFWMNRQVARGRPALIPNSLWSNSTFSAVTSMIAISFSVLNALEMFCSLFFQEIQGLSAIEAAIRILPSLIIGTVLNLTTGLFIHKVPSIWLATVPALLSAGAPIIMANTGIEWSYWSTHFIAQLLQPISSDILFTVGLIVITDVFPEGNHALAGAVFNTAAQFGNSFGLAVMQAVTTLVMTKRTDLPELLAKLHGIRAGFWTMAALMGVCVVIGGVGFRKTGKIGVPKEDAEEEKRKEEALAKTETSDSDNSI